jgi:hypothetical protein
MKFKRHFDINFLLFSCLASSSILNMEAEFSSETSTDFHQTTHRHIPGDRIILLFRHNSTRWINSCERLSGYKVRGALKFSVKCSDRLYTSIRDAGTVFQSTSFVSINIRSLVSIPETFLRVFIIVNTTVSWGIHLSPAIAEQGTGFEFLSGHQLS